MSVGVSIDPSRRRSTARAGPGAGHVICAFERTDVARHAARAAAWLAGRLDAPLVLAHVFDPMGIGTPPVRALTAASLASEDLEQGARDRARLLLADAATTVGDVDTTVRMPEGRPVEELLRLAAECRPRLLVTGTAARGRLDQLLVGSVSSALAARAPCPVVVVPPGAALEEPGPIVALLLAGTRGRAKLRGALLGSLSTLLVRAAGRPVALVPAGAADRPVLG